MKIWDTLCRNDVTKEQACARYAIDKAGPELLFVESSGGANVEALFVDDMGHYQRGDTVLAYLGVVGTWALNEVRGLDLGFVEDPKARADVYKTYIDRATGFMTHGGRSNIVKSLWPTAAAMMNEGEAPQFRMVKDYELNPPGYIGVGNGVVRLEDKVILRGADARPALCTVWTDREYMPGTWKNSEAVEWLYQHWGEERIEYLAGLLGTALWGNLSADMIITLEGPPRAGKGTLAAGIRNALGVLSADLSGTSIFTKNRQAGGHTEFQKPLVEALIGIADEPRYYNKEDAKRFSGGEHLSWSPKGLHERRNRIRCTQVLIGNEGLLPGLGLDDPAMRARIHVIHVPAAACPVCGERVGFDDSQTVAPHGDPLCVGVGIPVSDWRRQFGSSWSVAEDLLSWMVDHAPSNGRLPATPVWALAEAARLARDQRSELQIWFEETFENTDDNQEWIPSSEAWRLWCEFCGMERDPGMSLPDKAGDITRTAFGRAITKAFALPPAQRVPGSVRSGYNLRRRPPEGTSHSADSETA